jgi:hypothetical protein
MSKIDPDEKTIKIIRRIFSNKNIIIGKKGEVIQIETEDGEHCASFGFYTDSIFIQNLDKCGITRGTELLQSFDKLAEEMPNIKHIDLEDESIIEICDELIYLYLIKILTKGQSWYNSHGYFSENHESDKRHNERFINMKYQKLEDDVYDTELKKFTLENSIETYKRKLLEFEKKVNDLDFNINHKIKSKKKQKITTKQQLDLDKANYKYYEKLIVEYKYIIKNYETRIVTIIDEYKRENEKKKSDGNALFPDADVNNMTVAQYFQYVLTDIKSNIEKDGCSEETNKKCKWLSNITEKILEYELIKYSQQLRKIFRSGESIVKTDVKTDVEPVVKAGVKTIAEPVVKAGVKNNSKKSKNCLTKNCMILGGYKNNKSKKRQKKK